MTSRVLLVCLAALVGVTALCATACDLGAGPLRVRKILVDMEPEAERLGREQVRAVVEKTVRRLRGVRVVGDGRGEGAVLRVRVESFGASVQEGELPRSTLSLSVDVTGIPGEAQSGYRGQATAGGASTSDPRELVAQALRDALGQVLMTRAASDLSSAELISWLESPEASPDQKRRAIRVLGSRRDAQAVPALGRILALEDNELQPLALGALANIGDPGGIDAVLAYAEGRPTVVAKQCIEAVRAMGSRRGKAWLFTLSTGHPDDDVQRSASAALAWVESREAAHGSEAPPTRTVAESTRGPPDEVVR